MKRSLFTIWLVLAVLVGTIWAAIALDAADASTEGANDTVHTSASFTVANQANRLLIDSFGYNSSNTSTGVTFNADALTHLVSNTDTGNAATCEIWYRIAPDVATSNGEVTISSSRLTQTVIALYNVDQTTPFRDSDSETGTTTTITADRTLTTVSGDWVLSCIYVRRAGGLDPGALTADDGTEIEEIHDGPGLRHACSYRTATGTTTTVGWDWAGPNDDWVHVAAAVAPAASGTPIHYYRKMSSQ